MIELTDADLDSSTLRLGQVVLEELPEQIDALVEDAVGRGLTDLLDETPRLPSIRERVQEGSWVDA